MLCGYMRSMTDKDLMNTPTTFLRTVWQAYEAVAKSCTYAGYLARQNGRGEIEGSASDYAFNSMDSSPNFDKAHKEKYARSSQTNFQALILGNEGIHQRMCESSKELDKTENMSTEFRKQFKYMTGYQHVYTVGVNPETGKETGGQYVAYNMDTFDPAGTFKKKVMPAFLANVEQLADNLGYGGIVKQSLNNSGLREIGTPGENNHVQEKLRKWLQKDCRLDEK